MAQLLLKYWSPKCANRAAILIQRVTSREYIILYKGILYIYVYIGYLYIYICCIIQVYVAYKGIP